MIRVRKRESRRRFLALAASATLSVLSSCGGDTPSIGVQPSGSTSVRSDATPTPARLLGILPLPAPPSPTSTPVPIVLRFAHWETGPAGQALTDLTQSFNRANSSTIVQPEVSSFGIHFQNLQQSFAAGNPPDVFVTSGAFFDDQRQTNALVDLGQRMTIDGIDLTSFWSEPIVEPINGQLYALPLWAAVDLVLLNLDRLSAAGVDVPVDGWTWSTYLVGAQKATIGKPGEISRWGTLIVNDFQAGWGSFITTNSGHWLDSNRHLSFDRAATEALRWVADAMLVHHVAPTPTEQHALTRGGTLDPFLSGNVAFFPTGTWEIPAALAQATFKWDVVAMPRATASGNSFALGSVQPGALAQKGQQIDLAWQFLTFILGRESQKRLAGGKIRLPALKEVAQDSVTGYSTTPPVHATVAVQAMANARDLQFTSNWQALRGDVVSALDRAFDGRISLDEGIAAAVLAGNVALAQTAPIGE